MDTAKLNDVSTMTEQPLSRPEPWEALSAMATQIVVASDAQFSIWKLKILRMVFMAALVLPVTVALLGLLIYAFVLLDRTLGIALDQAQLAPWASPLIRGSLYFGITMISVWAGWNRMVAQADGQE